MSTPTKRALILVDLQNDFCPGGNLAVPEGDAVVPLANQLMPHFDFVIATQDWHPAGHHSFASHHENRAVGELIDLKGVQQVLWPDHCVQNTRGAEFHPELNLSGIHKIIQKGTHQEVDSYSAFFDNAAMYTTELKHYLDEQGIKEIYVLGLATDYCVKYTCLDAIRLGYTVHLIADACRGVDLHAGDITRSLDEMRKAGVKSNDTNKTYTKYVAYLHNLNMV